MHSACKSLQSNPIEEEEEDLETRQSDHTYFLILKLLGMIVKHKRACKIVDIVGGNEREKECVAALTQPLCGLTYAPIIGHGKNYLRSTLVGF